MATDFLARLRAITEDALRLTSVGALHRTGSDDPAPATQPVFSRLASRTAELARADTSWQPKASLIRVEIMASGSFDSVLGIRNAVNRLQDDLVAAIRKGALELRLTEVRHACRHSTAWSRQPVDPGASTTIWECFGDAFAAQGQQGRTLFAQAFHESLRNRVNHVIVFGDRFDDGLLLLSSAIRAFRRQGVRVSTFYLGDDFNSRNMYNFLAVSTGGIFVQLPDLRCLDAVLPIVAAFACGDRARLDALAPATPEAKALITQLRRR
jgi:hypothetical protein